MNDKVNKKKIRVVVDMPEGSEPLRMMNEIKDKKGYSRNPAVFLDALATLHRKTFPGTYYSKRGTETEEEEAARKLSEGEEKKGIIARVEHTKKLEIANKLFGAKVYQDEASGTWRVAYKTYSGKTGYERNVPLDNMTEDMIVHQFYPSKEKVMELLPELFGEFKKEIEVETPVVEVQQENENTPTEN